MAYSLQVLESAQKRIQKMKKKKGDAFSNQIKKALKQLREDITHPGLNVHPVVGYPGWKEAYINRSDRIIFTIRGDVIFVAWVGSHTELDHQAFSTAIKQSEFTIEKPR